MSPNLESEPSKEANVKFDDLDVDAALKKEGMNSFLFIFITVFYVFIIVLSFCLFLLTLFLLCFFRRAYVRNRTRN